MLHAQKVKMWLVDVANIYVKELDENITPHVLDNTPPVLTVGYRFF